MRYWRTVGQDRWRFATPEGYSLNNHAAIAIQRHVKVKGKASPFDGNLLYWAKRLQQSHPLTMSKLGALLHKQQGKCRWCGLLFQDGDLIEIDHITPRKEGGTDERSNLVALHRHCHDQRHAKKHEEGTHDKSYQAEEPDELETLMSGSVGGTRKPAVVIRQGGGCLPYDVGVLYLFVEGSYVGEAYCPQLMGGRESRVGSQSDAQTR